MKIFYAYLWLREDGTPYYVGKGSGNRAFRRHGHQGRLHTPKDRSRILLFVRASEADAFATERELIANWGRKNLGTGMLHNQTDGGEGPAGRKISKEARRNMSLAKKGKPFAGRRFDAKGYTHSEETRKKWRVSKSIHHREAMKKAWILRRQQGKTNQIKRPMAEETKQKMSTIARARAANGVNQGCCAPDYDYSTRQHVRWHIGRGILNPKCTLCRKNKTP